MGAADPLAAFLAKVKPQPNGCHTYGNHGLEDYVTVGLFGGSFRAHRVAWMVRNGAIPDGMHVHHKCENPGCVNPDHLQTLTPSAHLEGHHRQRLPGHLMGKLDGIIDAA